MLRVLGAPEALPASGIGLMGAYDGAARAYLGAGWSPIPIHGKTTPVPGATGYEGTVTPEKVEAWLSTDWDVRVAAGRGVGLDNIALRHQLTIAIDVDQGYGSKGGVASLKAWAEKQGLPPLPATWSSTARGDDSPSRQYLYRVSEDLRLKTKPCDSVELCCWHHRFTVCWPSIHPTTGSVYIWYQPGEPGIPPTWGAPGDTMPQPELLPMLPEEWYRVFKGVPANADRSTAAITVPELFATFPAGPPDGLVRHLINKWSDEAQHVGHDEGKNALIHAFMLGREGRPGVTELFTVIINRYTAYLAVDRPAVAAHEAKSLVEACSVIAQQKPLQAKTDYNPFAALLPDPAEATVQPAALPTIELGTGVIGPPTQPAAAATTQTANHDDLSRFLLPAEFWISTPILTHIYVAAMSWLCSPDAVLHAVLAYVASLLHHDTRVDTGKRPSVLVHYCAAIGASGGGKTEALSCARELIAEWRDKRFGIVGLGEGYAEMPIGSGEGLIDTYLDDVKRVVPGTENAEKPRYETVTAQVLHNVMAYKGEGRELLAIDARKGSTVLSVLCDMWSGDMVGQGNSKRDGRRRILKAGSYSLGLLLGFQVAKVDPLFEDAAGGAPQRFAFAPAEYAPHADHLEVEPPAWPGPLMPNIHEGAVTVRLVGEIRQEVVRHIRLRAAGKSGDGPLDGHRMLLRCRIAALLALLHGDTTFADTLDVSPQMWELAGQIDARSCALRDWLAAAGQRRATEQAKATDERYRRRQVQAAREVEADAEQRKVEKVFRVAAVVGRRVADAGNEGATHTQLRDAVGRDRDALEEAIGEAQSRSWIVRGDGKRARFTPGPQVGDVPR